MSYNPPPPPPPPPPFGPSPQYGGAPSTKPSNYLVWSILTTLFCCLPLGIVAIIQSTKVDSLWTTGQYGAARKASEDAKKWNIIGLVLAVVLGIGYFVFIMVFAAGTSSYGY